MVLFLNSLSTNAELAFLKYGRGIIDVGVVSTQSTK